MIEIKESSLFYSEAIKFIELNNYAAAIKSIRNNINYLNDYDDIALAFLNCGFLNCKSGNYDKAIKDFSESIFYEDKLEILNGRSKDISFSGRSDSKYKNADYEGAIKDKRKAKRIRLLEVNKSHGLINIPLDYRNLLLGTFSKLDLDPKYLSLVMISRVERNKYDLIEDYKKVINKAKQMEVINKLELLSESKYKIGDFKGSIKAIRRAEKYY